jgi:antitoxin ParD1/3/4
MATMNISLPDEMKAMVEQRVRSGLYANASDYIRDLIRDDFSDDWLVTPEIAAAIDEGEASGLNNRSFGEIIAEARTQFAAG